MDDGSIDTGTVRFRLRDDGILHGVALPDREQTIEDAHQNLDALRQLTKGKRAPLLLDIRDTGTLSPEARQLFAGEQGASAITMLAMVGNSAFTRVVGNLFIRFAKPNYPVRLFGSDEEASSWLREFLP